jgi:chorismate mutase/prephenate dehydratase
MGTELSKLRKRIDEIDEALLGLLKERLEVAKRIGAEKDALGLPIRDPGREDEVLAKARRRAEDLGLNPEVVEKVFRSIIELSIACQGRVSKVAYLGPRGTHTEEAAKEYFGTGGTEFRPYWTVEEVFRAVDSGETDWGIVPVENSLEGSVPATLSLLLDSSLLICGEIERRIRHCLLASPGTRLEDIRIVFSHPQALMQCKRFLENILPKAEKREVSSTAKAVEMAKSTPMAAAIGTEASAQLYGMEILAKGIEDHPNNYTRFLVIGRKRPPRTGNDKTSLIFSVPNVPGALHGALGSFALRNINLVKVESRPTKGKPWEYIFYVDFEGHLDDQKCKEALEELKSKTSFLKVLGSYPKHKASIQDSLRLF